MSPTRVLTLLGFMANYAVDCYGYVNILRPRWGKAATWTVSMLILGVGMVLAPDDILFVPVRRLLFLVPLIIVPLALFYRDKLGAKIVAYAIMNILELLCDAVAYAFIGIVYPEETHETILNPTYSLAQILPRVLFTALLFGLVSLLIWFWKRRNRSLQAGEQQLAMFAAAQVVAQTLFLSLVLNSVETGIHPAYYGLLLSMDVAGLVTLALFLSVFRNRAVREARIRAVREQKQMEEKYAKSLASYSEAATRLKAEMLDSVKRLREQMETSTQAQLLSWDTEEGVFTGVRFPRQYADGPAVNTLMTEKIRDAEAAGVDFECRTILDVPQMSEFALCTVLSNMLDNAIAAVCQTDGKRWITLSCVVKGGRRSLVCSNAARSRTRKLEEREGEHGLGIAIIRTTAREYGGEVFVKSSPDSFSILVTFPEPATSVAGASQG